MQRAHVVDVDTAEPPKTGAQVGAGGPVGRRRARGGGGYHNPPQKIRYAPFSDSCPLFGKRGYGITGIWLWLMRATEGL